MCRRGMKELDVMLERYFECRWPEAGAGERAAFVELLEMQDPDLWDLLKGLMPDPGSSRHEGAAPTVDSPIGGVIVRIRALSGL